MNTWHIKPSTIKDLSGLYGLTYHIFKKHIRPIERLIGKRIGYYYTIPQILLIFEFMGPPPLVNIIYTSS